MNENKFLSYLESYHQWLDSHKEKALEEIAERESHAKDIRKFDKEKLLNITADEIYDLLSPLWVLRYLFLKENTSLVRQNTFMG